MKARSWAISGATIGILSFAALRVEGQVKPATENAVESRAVKTVRTDTASDGKAAVRDSGPAGGATIDADGTTQTILASDIGTRVRIIGRLGCPLGELVTIQGAWISLDELAGAPVKDYSPSFVVASVNGKKLEKPVPFEAPFFTRAWDGEAIPQKKGHVWELRGCETGGFRGTPEEVRADAVKGREQRPAVAHPSYAYRFKFYTEFKYSSFKGPLGIPSPGAQPQAAKVGAAAPADDPVKEDRERLQGTWSVTKVTLNGRAVKDRGLSAARLTFRENELVMDGGEGKERHTIRLDTKAEPRAFFTTRVEPAREQSGWMIYAFDGDKLRIGFNDALVGRPGSFEPAEKLIVIELERANDPPRENLGK